MSLNLGILAIPLFCLPAVIGNTVVGQTPGSTTSFKLPHPRRINIAIPLDCRSVATSFVSEKDGRLETTVSAGTDHLAVGRRAQTLLVTVLHAGSGVPEETDLYTITAETVDFISAVESIKLLPVVHSLVINKRLGAAVWTESDSSFMFVSDYPVSTDVYLSCRN